MGRTKQAEAPQWQSPVGFAVDANKTKANKMRAEYTRLYAKVRDLAQATSWAELPNYTHICAVKSNGSIWRQVTLLSAADIIKVKYFFQAAKNEPAEFEDQFERLKLDHWRCSRQGVL